MIKLCTIAQDKRVTQNLSKLVVKEHEIVFSSDFPTEVTREWILTQHNGSKHAESCKDVPFGSLHDGRPHSGSQIPQKPPKSGRRRPFHA